MPPRHAAPWRVLVPVLVLAVSAVVMGRVGPPRPPDFYTAPEPLSPGEHGTPIRVEAIEPPPRGARAWRMLYLSTDLHGNAVAVSGVVVVPTGPPPAQGRPVVAWAHPSTGLAAECAPSLRPAGGAAFVPGLDALLAAGYVVSITDYPGLGSGGPHPYLVGESEGMAVLDSVRAARALPGSGASSRFAVWGHSQGGHGALFAGQLATAYAPDLQLVGIAAAAPPTDLSQLLQHDIGGVTGNVFASMTLVSWSDVYADQGLRLDQIMRPQAVPVARRIAQSCVESRRQLAVDLPDAEVLRVQFLDQEPWHTPGWDDRLAENTPGATPIGAPVLVAQGSADTVVWPGVTADWVSAQCRQGRPVTTRFYEGATHTDIAGVSAADTVAWLADRFAGAATPAAATTPPVTCGR